jgi:hypothetical protein
MFGAALTGWYEERHGKEKTKTDVTRWTPEQAGLAKDFISYVQPYVGKGATAYPGQLPGTAGAGALQTKAFEQLEGLQYGGPEDWKKRVKDYLKSRREYLAPAWEEEEALLGGKMATMGLQHSTDMVKEMLDLKKTRTAQESMIGAEKYDAYERFATLELPQVMAEIGNMQREIAELGLSAEFQEFLRTQPEYSPYLDLALSILGMYPVEYGKIKTATDEWGWGAKGEASYDAA